MTYRYIRRPWFALIPVVFASVLAVGQGPVVTITSPRNNAQTMSPVNFVASAVTKGCPQGISSMRIYSAPFVSAFTGGGHKINTYITLAPGTYNAVVQAWDYCGRVGKTNVTITATGYNQPAGFVYTINSDYNYEGTTSNIRAFTIVASNGALAPTLQGPVTANVDPASITSDKGGYRVYVGDYVSGDVFPYFVDRRYGWLSPVPGAPFAAHRSVSAVAVHPSGTLIFAALSEYAPGDGISVFQLQGDGSLQEAPGSPITTQTGIQAFAVDPGGKYLYAADGSGYIEAFAIDTTSASLTALPGAPYQVTNSNCVFPYLRDVIDPAGTYLYTADATSSAIDGYRIDPNAGTLTQLANSPWSDMGQCQGVGINDPLFDYSPKSIAMDGTGKFLYALNELDSNIAVFSVGSNGALKFVKFAAQDSACFGAVRTDPTGNYLYSGACTVGIPLNFGGLAGYSINHTTGDLTLLPTSPYTYPQPGRTAVQDVVVTP